MNAFCGIYQLNNRDINRNHFAFVTNKLALWKPKRQDQFIQKNLCVAQWSHKTHQSIYPTTNHLGHLLLASNSRIDNRDELADKLQLPKEERRTLSDEEFILHAYTKWQDDCPQYLVGDFVFVIWDENKKQLYLARDQVGHNKIIYYYYNPGKLFVFASNIRPVYSHPDVPNELNEVALAQHMIIKKHTNNETLNKNIFSIPTGNYLVVKNNLLKITPYFDWHNNKKICYKNSGDYIDHFNEIFHKAVNARLRNSPKIGCFLSGGLDSSSVISVAAKILQKSGQSIYAFGAIPPKDTEILCPEKYVADESIYMEAITNKYSNIKLTKVINNLQPSILTNLEQHHLYAENPCTSPFNRPWIEQICELAQSNNITTLLIGSFGNLGISWPGSNASSNKFDRLIRQCHWTLRQLMEHMSGRFPWDDTPFASNHLIKKYHLFKYYLTHLYPGLYTSLDYSKIVFSSDMSECYANLEARYNIEYRDPTSDLNVLKFCAGIPKSLFRDQSGSRLLIRKAMSGILPEMIRTRTKFGLQCSNWHVGYNQEYDLLSKKIKELSNSPRRHYYDTEKLTHLIQEWPNENITADNVRALRRKYHILLVAIVYDTFIKDRFG